MPEITIRSARFEDAPLIAGMIRELAEYERLLDECHATVERIEKNLFGAEPAARAIIAELNGEPVGYAIYFRTFSTFEAKPGVYLEDLYVREEHRGKGAGKALFTYVLEYARSTGAARYEWAVLPWNTPAIQFYESFGACLIRDWHLCRINF